MGVKLGLKERILTVAMQAFKQHGIRNVRMDDIATTLAISKRTIYETYSGSVLKPSCKLPPHAHNFISLYRKNGISVTPLNCALKALTFALKDSAFALVALLTKKLSMVS